ncbi:type II secretion system protein [Psychrosphaera ytuae]|uniref:Type II secretion system protein n=1 Tax=Psychrosphaera ytuae TaxID=2820710 RepID=A0A975D9U6_9GAMM|nr:type II secretion system protein [Psychrosphaera ytuae]QTH63187.1 type II secretion system protein [Psychrosphaera ytuae]
MRARKDYGHFQSQRGFTLVEMVVGITALSVALLLLTGVLVPQAERSTDPWFQVRSAELAQSLMNEINARSFDENSSRTGGQTRCNESSGPACTNIPTTCPTNTSASKSWVEENSRDLYDDVDDFHCFEASGDTITNIEDQALINVYKEFSVSVRVVYAGSDLGLSNQLAKRITVSVTPPRGSIVNYTTYRTNY